MKSTNTTILSFIHKDDHYLLEEIILSCSLFCGNNKLWAVALHDVYKDGEDKLLDRTLQRLYRDLFSKACLAEELK